MNDISRSLYSALYPRLPIFAQNAACTAGGYLRFRARFSRHFHRVLARWDQSLHWSDGELRELQRQRLVELIERARTSVPYYRDLPPVSDHRDPQQAIEATLGQIPPLDKRAYRDQPRAFLSRRVPRRHLQRGQTSGTTGTALPLFYTPETLAEEYATVWRMRRRVGLEIRDPHLSFTGQIIVPITQKQPPYWRVNSYNDQTLFSIYHMTPTNLRSYVDAIHATRARYVQGYPSSIHLVALAMLEQDRPLPPGRLAAVFTSSESLLAFQRETIQRAFGCRVLDRYGVSEFGVSMTECDSDRLHLDMEFGIAELEVHEETPESETGPLLITGLAVPATPLLRYRIGDVGTRAKTPCPCGRAGDSFFEVDGRIEDYVMTPDGRLVGRMDHVFKDQLAVAEAQILQSEPDSIRVLIVPRAEFNETSERSVLRQIRSRLGDEIGVSIEIVDSIRREPNGKFRAVKSAVGRNAP